MSLHYIPYALRGFYKPSTHLCTDGENTMLLYIYCRRWEVGISFVLLLCSHTSGSDKRSCPDVVHTSVKKRNTDNENHLQHKPPFYYLLCTEVLNIFILKNPDANLVLTFLLYRSFVLLFVFYSSFEHFHILLSLLNPLKANILLSSHIYASVRLFNYYFLTIY